ncbi:MAG TPA: SUMF1/EgtB/PvdO family nonheme iron enzyme [Pirellulaceae bacterium]|nr:SUMF1/EgtB/PvdO family nonheme iron enzyme [Pirellulaceae bacterium]
MRGFVSRWKQASSFVRVAWSVGAAVVVVVVAAPLLLFAQFARDAIEDRNVDERIKQLISQLNDESYVLREAAVAELRQHGERALPALRRAERDRDDMERRLQAQRVARTIMLSRARSRSTGMEFVLVESGGYWIGSPPNELNRRAEELAHIVYFSEPLLIGKHEVTQYDYWLVTGANPSSFALNGADAERVGKEVTARHPVENVTWFDAIEFCNRLSRLDRLPPYYRIENARRDGIHVVAADVSPAGGNGYRLPTEAEWECACRAGSRWPFHFGSSHTGKEANLKPGGGATGGYGGPPTWTAPDRPVKIGGYAPNYWGLFDCHGNVAEWCWDWYAESAYQALETLDPTGPADGKQRVVRGGSWMAMEGACRSACRGWQPPNESRNYVGFRVCRTPSAVSQSR